MVCPSMTGTRWQLALTEKGRYELRVGSVDMGQGNATAFIQMAAHELGCRVGDIDLLMGDTLLGPDSGPSSASRNIFVIGLATVRAARDLLQKVLTAAADALQSRTDRLELVGATVLDKGNGQRLPLAAYFSPV